MTQSVAISKPETEAANPARRIELGGCFNFRDIGGYTTADGRIVRWRRLFRSDALHRLSEDDLDLLRPFGISSIIDLRTDRELDEAELGLLHAEPGAIHLRAPFIAQVEINLDSHAATPPDLADLYANMLTYARPAIATVFTHLAAPSSYPAIVHCAAGKDRTGMTIALILRTLGVSDKDIVADYALTEGFLASWVEVARAAGQTVAFNQVHPNLLRSQAITMRTTLAAIDAEFGSTAAFLNACGISPTTIDGVRANLVGEDEF